MVAGFGKALDKDKYGKFRIYKNGKKIDMRAHVYSYILHSNNPIPTGLQVCHTCDVTSCVNPLHLFLGAAQDNTTDKCNKERQARGESIGCSKLIEKEVIDIRNMFRTNKYSEQKIADIYRVSTSCISDVISRKTWKHIP
jgi:hypothetical protein